MDDLRDENLEEHENADALLDDSIFEEVELDLIDEDELKPIIIKDGEDEEESDEDEEILDELDLLAAEEEEDELDFYGDEDEE